MRCIVNLLFFVGMFVRLMPQKISELLAVEEMRMGVLTKNEASDVLRTAFQNTEDSLDFPYEVCCLLWTNSWKVRSWSSPWSCKLSNLSGLVYHVF